MTYEGTVIAVVAGPGVAGEVVTVRDSYGLSSVFVAPVGTYRREDRVALKWVIKKRAVSASDEGQQPGESGT